MSLNNRVSFDLVTVGKKDSIRVGNFSFAFRRLRESLGLNGKNALLSHENVIDIKPISWDVVEYVDARLSEAFQMLAHCPFT